MLQKGIGKFIKMVMNKNKIENVLKSEKCLKNLLKKHKEEDIKNIFKRHELQQNRDIYDNITKRKLGK